MLHGSIKKSGQLTAKERHFCLSYVSHLNATRAAREAGYSSKTASTIGYQLLHKTSVSAEITRLTEELNERLKMDAREVLGRLAILARSNIGLVLGDDYRPRALSELSQEEQYMIEEIFQIDVKGQKQTRIKMRSPAKALEVLSKLQQASSNEQKNNITRDIHRRVMECLKKRSAL